MGHLKRALGFWLATTLLAFPSGCSSADTNSNPDAGDSDAAISSDCMSRCQSLASTCASDPSQCAQFCQTTTDGQLSCLEVAQCDQTASASCLKKTEDAGHSDSGGACIPPEGAGCTQGVETGSPGSCCSPVFCNSDNVCCLNASAVAHCTSDSQCCSGLQCLAVDANYSQCQ